MPRIDYVPKPYQTEITQAILDNDRCAIWSWMGSGKTVATLTAISIMLMLDDTAKVLVIAPLRVAKSTWPAEGRKWAHLSELSVVCVAGSPAEKKKLLAVDSRVFTINYEQLPWLVSHFGDAWPFSVVVADESTRLKSFRLKRGGMRARFLGKVAHTHVKRFIQLTGTPTPNGLLDLWGQAWFIDRGERLGRTYTAFCDRWFKLDHEGGALQPLPHAQDQITTAVKDICTTVDARAWFGVDEPVVSTFYVDLPPESAKMYRQFERDMVAGFQDETLTAVNAGALTMKCLQLANGAFYNEEKDWVETHTEKIEALKSIIEDAGGAPVLVAYQFISDLQRLQRYFPEGRHLDKDAKTIDDWNNGKIPVLFAHPKSAGHGLNLQYGGNILAFFGHWWSLEEYQQIMERIGPMRQKQAGFDRRVFIYNIVARGTVDELVLERRATKTNVQELVLKSMTKKGCDYA